MVQSVYGAVMLCAHVPAMIRQDAGGLNENFVRNIIQLNAWKRFKKRFCTKNHTTRLVQAFELEILYEKWHKTSNFGPVLVSFIRKIIQIWSTKDSVMHFRHRQPATASRGGCAAPIMQMKHICKNLDCRRTNR